MTKNKKRFTKVNQHVKHPKLSQIQKHTTDAKLFDLPIKDSRPSISLKYIDLTFNSFHDLRTGDDLKKFDEFIKKVNSASDWNFVYKHYRKANSDGKRSKKRLQHMGMDHNQINIFHLRVSRKYRVHGFLLNNRFKLIWIDPNHEIDKE